MLSLGVIGIYIAKIYEEVKGRPRYFYREKDQRQEKVKKTSHFHHSG